MTKLGDLRIGTTILCDDIRREQGNNKLILIGVYSGDLILPELPTEILLSVYTEIVAPKGPHDIEMRLSGPQKAHGILKARFDNVVAGVGTIVTPRIAIYMAEEGTFRIDVRIPEGRWTNILSKQIILGSDSTASQPPSEQSPPAAPA